MLASCLASAVLLLVAANDTAYGKAAERFSWSLTIDGRHVSQIDADRPLPLSPGKPARISVRITNLGEQSVVRVRTVRMEARVLGLTLFSYDTRVDMRAAPGRSDQRTFSIDLIDLSGQATGLLPARVVLLDQSQQVVASRAFVVNVYGSLRSVYGVFGIAIAAITAVLLAGALWQLLTGRQHRNRWRRAVVFAIPGLGVGFVLTFTLSALRVLVPSAAAWALLIFVGGCIGFVAGYLSPQPPDRSEQDAAPTDAEADAEAPALADENDHADDTLAAEPAQADTGPVLQQ